MTDVGFSNLLSELNKSASELNAGSETVNSVLASVETQLTKMNLGFEVWVPDSLTSAKSANIGTRIPNLVLRRLVRIGPLRCGSGRAKEIRVAVISIGIRFRFPGRLGCSMLHVRFESRRCSIYRNYSRH